MTVDARMREAAARPVIVPDQVVIDHGRVFVSETFMRACERLGISIQPARKGTPTDKGVVEATFDAIKTLFAQHVAGFKGANPTMRGRGVAAEWTIGELQDLLDEWLIVGWQHRPHDALRDPHAPRRDAVAERALRRAGRRGGYLPVTLTGSDYLELLPVKWRAINDYGIRIDNRTYNCAELGPLPAPALRAGGQAGAVGGPLRPLRPVAGVRPQPRRRLDHRAVDAPGDGRRPVRRLHLAARAAGLVGPSPAARSPRPRSPACWTTLLTRAEHGPDTGRRARSPPAPAPLRAARGAHTRARRAGHGGAGPAAPGRRGRVIPFGVFDADAEAERWL